MITLQGRRFSPPLSCVKMNETGIHFAGKLFQCSIHMTVMKTATADFKLLKAGSNLWVLSKDTLL
ncbi:hypothetical protein CSA37_03565 [Candidatus Fermentibacteria bacterium]|nr:MAG: hypothetical protein CSA37_03565 [Candidatus Fermentibacteria bacterium]